MQSTTAEDVSAQSAPSPGDYFQVDYDPNLDQFSHHKPGWWNVRRYLEQNRPLDGNWVEVVRSALKENLSTCVLGRLTADSPEVALNMLEPASAFLRGNICLEGGLAAEFLLLAGVDRGAERKAVLEFNRIAGEMPRVYAEFGPPRPYALKQRPLCVAVWHVDKNESVDVTSVNFALQAVAAAYFRLRWVA